MMYKKIRLWGFIPWYVKMDLDEARKLLSTMEVLTAFAKRHTFNELNKHRELMPSDGKHTFKVEGKRDAKEK